MAEAVVELLIGTLSAVLAQETAVFAVSLPCKEASALRGLFDEISGAKEELKSMKAYLQTAERFKDSDKATSIFVNKIRDFAFEIEDVVDEFTYKLEDKHGGFAAKMKKRVKHVKTWRRLAIKMQEIKKRLKDADERKARYEMREIDKNAGTSGGHSKTIDQASYFAKDDNLVGIQEQKEVLMQWLKDDNSEEQSTVATVWGMGGVGKTTLVSHVYNSVKEKFDVAAWITVSNSYHDESLLKMIAKGFGVPADVASMGKRELTEVIKTYLQGKKYILIMDDVWGANVWFNIKDAFPTCHGSRFVITSRIRDVSLLATRGCVLELKPLQDDQSRELFYKEAFWKDGNKTCPDELKPLAQEFLSKCNGLPIAIACIGRLLSCKQPTFADWEDVHKGLDLHLTNSVILDVNAILKVSLEDLPYDLKNCFLHCALFPKNYEIKRRTIMRHWIAAGFIREEQNKTLEEVAEGYLVELVNRSLLQVVLRNDSGRLKSCRMHDVLRLLALKKAEDESFGKIYDGSRAFSLEGTRRLWIKNENIEQLSRSGAMHFRALHVFARYINIDLLKPILASSNLMSILDLQGAHIKRLPNVVFSLFNLRYLGLRSTAIEILPEAIGRLHNLEVLDACYTKLQCLPNNVVKLVKLRYLYACTSFDERFYSFSGGVKVPNGMCHLTALWALQNVEASSKFLREVGALTELRTFAVFNVRSEHSADLSTAITKLSYLVSLEIHAANEKEMLQLEGLCLPTTINYLSLKTQLEKTSMNWSHLNSLTSLVLESSHMDEESFSGLLVLNGLCYLVLYKAFVGKKLYFSSGSFLKLRRLIIRGCDKLNHVEIEDGAMARLASLWFGDCPELKLLPIGIEHLRALEDLYLVDTGEELIERLRQKGEPNEDLTKISHIGKVSVELTKKGIGERIR